MRNLMNNRKNAILRKVERLRDRRSLLLEEMVNRVRMIIHKTPLLEVEEVLKKVRHARASQAVALGIHKAQEVALVIQKTQEVLQKMPVLLLLKIDTVGEALLSSRVKLSIRTSKKCPRIAKKK